MERRKRVYPVRRDYSHLVSGVLLAMTVAVVVTGLISPDTQTSFSLESLQQKITAPLDESFDETYTEELFELPEQKWYALQVGVFENEEAAGNTALDFQRRGAAGYLWLDGRYRVLAAAYSVREDAQQVRSQLREQHHIDSYLYTIEFPALSMRLTGMKGQIDILRAAFAHGHDLAGYIQSLSVQMDRQEVSVQEGIERLKAWGTQVELVVLRLNQRFAAPMPAAVQSMIECFEEYNHFTDSFTGEESSVLFGTKLKYQLLQTLQQIQTVYHTLNRT